VKNKHDSALLAARKSWRSFDEEAPIMAGFGRFKLTDALPAQPAEDELSGVMSGDPTAPPAGRGRGRGKAKGRKNKPSPGSGVAAEQVREARESNQAKNAETSGRDRMVDIGRGNQQAGRQRAK
jgi:hypothetical protein